MIDFNKFVEWYEDCCRFAIKNGDLPKDVTPEEAQAYMDWVYSSPTLKKEKKNE